MSDGVLPCPYPSSQPNNVVPTPGTLVDQGDRVVGGVAYRWYEWSATCILNGSPGAPVTHNFTAEVWWLPSAGIAFDDVTGHRQTSGILASVRVDTTPNSSTEPTTTLNPDVANPTSGIEFRSPSSNIHCEIDYGPPYSTSGAFCFSAAPPQSATLSDTGTYRTCSGESCLANPALNEIELPYGQRISLGPFSCTSATAGMTCLANGEGFKISRSGITAAA
ncbi:MAG TPA: hypothetical protein VFZ97_09825 [Acidimicrobiales bacterium]